MDVVGQYWDVIGQYWDLFNAVESSKHYYIFLGCHAIFSVENLSDQWY